MVFYNSMHKNSFFNNHKIRFKNNNLRFSGFTDEWNEVKLGDISKSITKGTTPKKYSDTGINFVKVESIENNKIYKIDAFIDENTHKNELSRSILKTNDLLFSIAGSLGRTTIVTENILPANTNQALSIIRFYDNCNCNLNFIQSRLNTYDIAKYIFQNLAVGAQPNLNLQQVGNIKIRIPSFNEQNKIQGFLECVDIKIELLKKKYQQYQEFKKYLMQQIFTQKLRFADSDSCWKEISLKDIGTFYRGHSYNSTNVADEGLLVLRSNNIQSNVLDFSEDGLQFVDKDCKKELELQKNDIVICMSNGTRRLVGKSAEYTGNYENKVTVGAFCSIFRTKNKLAKYLFQTESYKKNLYLILAGTNINNLKNSDLEKFNFNIPTNESEINKIHDLFVSIDNKMDYNKKQLEEITLFKKGLLQQMFVVQLILSLLQNKKHI